MASFRYMVEDVDEAVEFYTELLGFELVQQFGPAMAILEHDDLRLWLAGPQSSAAKPMPDSSKPAPGGWNRIVLTVDDIEATVAKLKDSDATFRNEIISGPGGRQTLLEDPSGNPIELFEAQG